MTTVKKLISAVAALAAVAFATAPAGASPYPEEMTEDTTWTKADSPVQIGAVHVLDGVTLTIEPGVRVESMLGSIIVEGTLVAEGTEAEPIVFTKHPSFSLWHGIGFSDVDPSTTSVVRNVVVEQATSGISMYGHAVPIHDSTFVGNGTAVQVGNAPNEVSFTGNELYSNDVAFKARTSATVELRHNDFWDNDVSLWFRAPNPYACGVAPGVFEVHENDILRGPDSEWFSFDVRTSDGSGTTGMVVDATDNWWGTTDPYDIAARKSQNFECCPGPIRTHVRTHPPSEGPHTPVEPPGPVGTPEPEPEGHGDPLWIAGVTEPDHGDCLAAESVRRIRGEVSPALGRPPKRLEVSFVRRVRSLCRSWHPNAEKFGRVRGCYQRRPFEVRVRDGRWTIEFGRRLRPGRYTVFAGSDRGSGIVSFRLL